MHREVAVKLRAAFALLDLRRLERDLRALLDVEEVGGAQMLVALLDAGIDAD
jgi:hypothetical protein